jgi:uncharacterized protein (DUF1684 family)
MLKVTVLLAAAVAGVQLMSAGVDSDYRHRIESWRKARVTHLEAPNGWLSLVGLYWLEDGANKLGSARDNDIVIPKAPPHMGVVTLKDGKAHIELAEGSAALIDGRHQRKAELLDDSHEHPTTVEFGSESFYLIERSGKRGLRVKDTEAPTRTKFAGLDYFPIDASWRVEATWTPFKPMHQLEFPTEIGTVDKMPVPGKATFKRGGKTYTLLPVLESPDARELFFVVADRTSGKQTYGAARFIDADPPKDGKVVIDFNQAYNPPCAFTPFATCPLAPPENRLDLAVTAGEKKYSGGHHRAAHGK